MSRNRISVIIPAKDEGKFIGELISGCLKYSNDIVVVDGHSRDDTRKIASGMGVRVYLDNKKGKGDGIRLGISKAKNEVIVFIDADGSHDPDDIPRLAGPILEGRADHVTGSRMRGGSDELHGDIGKFTRMVGSDIVTLGINYRFGVDLTDSQNGFRAIKRKVALDLDLKEDITTIEQEMIIKTLKKGYRMAEVPAHEYARKYGVSHIAAGKVWFRYVYSWVRYLFF